MSDTTQEELTVDTPFIVKNGKRVRVRCEEDPKQAELNKKARKKLGPKILCYATGNVLVDIAE